MVDIQYGPGDGIRTFDCNRREKHKASFKTCKIFRVTERNVTGKTQLLGVGEVGDSAVVEFMPYILYLNMSGRRQQRLL